MDSGAEVNGNKDQEGLPGSDGEAQPEQQTSGGSRQVAPGHRTP